ncbi:MAG: ABC transporter substrate-binding protein [Sporomusaceae bacterium]|nr:ABC transporter substrate-binding protein [Sporomusaceae bacterium]
MKRKLIPLLLVLGLTVILLAGCGQQTPQTSAATGPVWAPKLQPLPQPVVVTVGMKQVISDAGILIGMEKGYYRDLGIKIEAVQFNSGQEMINQLAAGQLDVGATVTASGLLNAMSRDIPVKIVADKGINVPGKGYYRLVVRKDLAPELTKFADLRGKRIAIVGTASLDEIALMRVLEKGGLTGKDIDMQVIRSFPDMLVSLANKSIDAAMLIEPFVTQGIARGFIDPWVDPVEYDPDAQTAFVVFGAKMTQNKDVANRFMTAYIKSVRDYNDGFFKNKNKQDIIDILVKASVIKDPKLYEQMYPTGLNPDGYVRMKGLEQDLAWYRQNNLLKSPDLKAADTVDNSFVGFAISILGNYK